MPKTLTYCRMNNTNTAELLAIEKKLRAVHDTEFSSTHTWGGEYRDDCRTALHALGQRPGGNKLLVDARRGDLVLFPAFEVFPDARDMYKTLQTFDHRGILAHFVDLGLTFSKEQPGALDFLHRFMSFDEAMRNWKLPIPPSEKLLEQFIIPMRERGVLFKDIAEKLNVSGFKHPGNVRWAWNAARVRAWHQRWRQLKREAEKQEAEQEAEQEELPCAPPSTTETLLEETHAEEARQEDLSHAERERSLEGSPPPVVDASGIHALPVQDDA